ncbi:hypothetical protein [Saccharopolyspora sp. ASAGF58]
MHFHAVIRLDGPDGAIAATPAWGTVELLADAVRGAHGHLIEVQRPGA